MDKGSKTIIITGATSGIGKASTLLFAKNGAKVIAIGRNEKEFESLLRENKELAENIKTFSVDLTDIKQIDKFFEYDGKHFNQVDVLVNSAGIIGNGSIENTILEDWDKMLDINLRSVFYVINKCLPYLEKTEGNIVNVSSVAGTRSFPNLLGYCVSKAGIDQLTRCAALDLAPKKIRVNAVNPGVVVTNLHKRGGMQDEAYNNFLEHSKATHPIGRVGSPEEIAELIYFLASEKAQWITGATYEIDGGRAQTCAR